MFCTSRLWVRGPRFSVRCVDECIALFLGPVSGIPECGYTLSESVRVASQVPAFDLSHVVFGEFSGPAVG